MGSSFVCFGDLINVKNQIFVYIYALAMNIDKYICNPNSSSSTSRSWSILSVTSILSYNTKKRVNYSIKQYMLLNARGTQYQSK